MKFHLLSLLALFLAFSCIPLSADGPTRPTRGEILEWIVKRGGSKVLAKSPDLAAETLERLAKKYGDDVLQVIDDTGLEFLEEIPKHGDELVDLAIKASPQARKAFARNLDELLPIARRTGTEVLELEAKSPGMAAKLFQLFGDDIGKSFAKSLPPEDIPRLVKYAEKADTPATRALLAETYQKEGASLFQRIPPKVVLAYGLTATMLYGTHRLTAPVVAAAEKIRDMDESGFKELAENVMSNITTYIFCFGLIVLLLLFWRNGWMPWHRSKPTPAEKEQLEDEDQGKLDSEKEPDKIEPPANTTSEMSNVPEEEETSRQSESAEPLVEEKSADDEKPAVS